MLAHVVKKEKPIDRSSVDTDRMLFVGAWFKAWVYLGLVCGWSKSARPRFDTSTDMGLVLVPADAEVDSVIFRLRATDQDADFPLVFEITGIAATITPVVRIDNLPCTLYNKVCQANVILTKRLMPGRLHDFAVRVRDTKGDSNSMQATISATNATTSRDKIFPHIPSLIMVPEDAKPGRELDYLLVRANSWSGKPVYIELWQPKELFTIRQRQTPTQTRGVITLIGELDFETQSMYTLTIYATDPYTEPGKDTRNIAGLNVVVIVQDVQDVPPIFTLAPPLTKLNNSVQIGDVILRVHAEDGDKGVPREITYGLVSEGNPFIPFFNISETTGEIVLAKPLEELTQITHVGAPVVLTVVAEEIRRSKDEPPAQATVVDVGFLLGEPGNSPPYFENDNYVTSIPENLDPGSVIMFPEQYSTRVHDEDIGKAGVFALKLQNNNGTFEINPTVAERTANFILMVRDNTLIDYEMHESLSFKIIAQEVGPATNLSASATVVIFIQDVNDNPPVFDEESYEVTLSENVTAGTRVIQVHATDKDTGLFGSIRYTGIIGEGSDAFAIDPDTGLITVAMGSSLDREMAAQLQLTVIARDENGKGNTGEVPLIVNLLDVNDNAPIFEKNAYEFTLNSDLTNFSTPAIIKATDADAEPPNNEIRYELIHGNYENKFYLNEITGELTLLSPVTKFRRKKQSNYDNFSKKLHKKTQSLQPKHIIQETIKKTTVFLNMTNSTESVPNEIELKHQIGEIKEYRRKRAETDILYTLTARAYDLGVPHLASETEIFIVRGTAMEARIMMFVISGDHPNLTTTTETLATITGGRITVLETRPYVSNNKTVTSSPVPAGEKRTIIVARVEQTEIGTPLVDVEKIRNILAANGVGIINGVGTTNESMTDYESTTKLPIDGVIHNGGDGTETYVNKTIIGDDEVTVYKAENKLLLWLLIILGLLMLLAIAALIICCICPGCPFYMAPRKRRIHSSETLIARSDGRPKRHLHRKPAIDIITSNGRKQAWSADPTRRNWQFNRQNTKNDGLASLPGDVVYISERRPIDQANVESLRLRDGPTYDLSRRRFEEQERIYVQDDTYERKARELRERDYDATEADSLQRHEIERGSDIQRQAYRQRYVDPELSNETAIREQHFYREGNAEVLQLVTRGEVEDRSQHRHYPTFIVDGKDVLLQRFMQDQKARHELPIQEPEVVRTIDSHQRSRNLYQHKQEILLLPEELDVRRRRAEELESSAQKLAMDDKYATQNIDAESQMRDVRHQEISTNVPGISPKDKPSIVKDQTQSTTMQSYTFHDMELARQNALLTRILLERESRHAGGVMMDAASYLETQSLPGQVAIGTQTDRAAATQTDRHVRSRSDNDESDEDIRNRKRIKKRHGESELRTRTLWMKTPIKEEEGPCFDKRLNILRKKVQAVKEGRKVSLEPEVLREISDSLDENGSTCREKARKSKTRQQYTEESSIGYKILGEKNGSSSSTEADKQHDKSSDEKRVKSLSSPEINIDNGKYIRETMEKTSTRKESRIKKQKKVESVIKPSFRVLEKEITMLTKKLSKLADKKVQQTTGSESTSQDKSKTSQDSKKDSGSTSKKTEDSKKHKRFEVSPSTSKETKKEKFKYQQPQIMSAGSSENEDAFEKTKKSKLTSQEAAKHKQTSSHTKVKRQTLERKERKKQIIQQDRELEKRRKAASKESGRPKTDKITSRMQKLAAIGRKKHISEELSTSTSSDHMNSKKDSFMSRDFDKSTESSEIPSNHADQQKSKQKLHVSEKFSDDFVPEPQRRDIDQPSVFLPIMNRNIDKEDVVNGKEDIEIIQQFSDDFVIEPQTKKLKHQMQATVESKVFSSNKENVYHDFDKEYSTLKETIEDLAIVQNVEDTQHKSETILDIPSKEQSELFEVSKRELKDSSKRIMPSDSLITKALEETEKVPFYSEKRAVERRIAYMSGKHKEIAEESSYETEQEMSEKEEVIPEKELHEIQRSKAVEEIVSEKAIALEKHIESLTKSIDGTEYIEEEKEEEHKNGYTSLYSSETDKTEELYKTESDQKEELSLESEKHVEEEISSTKDAIDNGQKMEELMQRENEEDLLREIKNDVERPKEYEIQESDVEKKEESTIHTTASEESFDTSRPFTDDIKNLNGFQRAFAIDDDTLLYIDETSNSDEASKSDHASIRSELTEVLDIVKETTDKDELQHLSDDLTTKIEIESHEIKKESHISPERLSDSHKTKEEEFDEDKLLTSLSDITTSKKEVIKEQLQVEHTKEKEESLFQEEAADEEAAEKVSAGKERSDEEAFTILSSTSFEVLDKESSIELPKEDSNLQQSTVSEPDMVESFVIISKSTAVAEPQDKGEQQADVSVPIFSSFIDDTLDVSEESDSSSDVSRKTTLTTRPYDTPRHRQKWQQQESIEIEGMSDVRNFRDGEDARTETELEEDTDSNLSLDELEKTEDSITTESTSELKEDIEIAGTSEKTFSDERISPMSLLKEGNDKDITDKDFESKIEIEESETDIKSEIKNLLTTIQDIVPLTLSIKELNDIPKENINDEIPAIKEDAESKSEIATPRKKIEKMFESVKQDDKSKTRSPSSKFEQVDLKKDKIITETIEMDKTKKIEDIEIGKIRSKESDVSLTSKKYITKTIPSERFVKKPKKSERMKVPSPGNRKRVLDKSKEKATPSYSQRRPRKFIDDDSVKQTESSESQKRSPQREEEQHPRKQQVFKSKFKTDKKATIPPKTGEVDISKTQSKYMAWYNKKREEAEKKRLEKKATDDEEQLPRWVSRNLKQTTKQREKLTVERKTPEMTPRTKRKIKPLVNVESEQLKAIVRQGRQLRKAEGNLKEDPTIQIFARPPPASTSDTQHRLLQHSEYKYERIPPPFYLHPPPVPHPSPQLSPERCLEMQPCGSQYEQSESDLQSENAASFQSGGRLRHQQLLEKKSVFDIAYSEAAPSQLRSDSTTPPS
ncbi:PREDICTED: cadherin-86C [Acromyrmex echinatior]|uniref:cadherin-86C n=1 Tax=Acromyrmex echinatior TaxID=103372 RepID=UPI000580C22E|nr:PREDICTED: cadherin-86C [Acromyrmex echinatior]